MVLDIKNLNFSYGKKVILKDLNLSLKSEQSLGILWPNGIGKSTLIRILLSLLPSFSGQISLNGKNFGELSLKERAKLIGYVPQNEKPSFAFSVLDMIMLGKNASIGLFKSPSKKDIDDARHAAILAGCEHLLSQNVDELSGGQMQLVLIARAIVSRPKLLIMDEPTSFLDTTHQDAILSLISRLNHQGMAVIFSSHYPNHTYMISHLSLLLNGEKGYICGATKDVLNEANLKSLFGTDFIMAQIEDKTRIMPRWSV